ncbi:probable 2-oxoglutarate-dependent dioxygenase AOP1 [Tripterygium wilfordii]|uniref:probable 2-oxoglutarate-dependent dioxygenase AOP1 n=1 Tax=Tripterygium wilfordii TaxID=458696 RepID=UPI0018F82551|nr:probable 2-oxoglutarate-dependent dioxygenase AOP1 [Tripterygium wilfordii]
MGSLETLKVPVMDFTKPGALNPGSPEWDSLKVQVKEALKEYGCFQALYNKVPEELHKALFGAAEELFDLPTHIKKLNVCTQPLRGYICHKYPTVVEGMGVEGADVFDEVENFTKTFWPQGNPNFRFVIYNLQSVIILRIPISFVPVISNAKMDAHDFIWIMWNPRFHIIQVRHSSHKTIHSFSREVVELEKMVCRMVFESLGVEKYLQKHMDSTDYLLKFMKYSPLDQNTAASTGPHIGLPSHTDKSTISILYDNEVGGLELQTKNGEWISIQLSPDKFFVLIGDVFHAWSNGHLHTPYHRVTKRGKETRYSAQLFSTPKEGHLVKVPEELVDEQHPLLFKPFCHDELNRFYVASHASGKFDATITDYCGVDRKRSTINIIFFFIVALMLSDLFWTWFQTDRSGSATTMFVGTKRV